MERVCVRGTMSTHGAMMGDGAGNAVGNDAMSTDGDSVNQNVPRQPPMEDVGGSLAPQDNVLPGVSTYDGSPSLEPMLDSGAQPGTSLVPAEVIEMTASVGGYDPAPSFGSYQHTQGVHTAGSVGTAASASVAAAATVVTQTAITAAQQSVIAGQQAQHATQQSAAAGQQAQQAFNVGASAWQHTQTLRNETSQALGQVKTGLETLHERQGAALSMAQHSDTRSSEAVRLVEELRQARIDDQKSFTDRMSQMEQALKRQMEVAENALKSINTLRQELDTSRAESRTLRQQLTESNWRLSSLSDQQTRAQQAQAQSAAQAAERERTMMQRAEEIAARFSQLQQSRTTGVPSQAPPTPSQPAGTAMSAAAGPSQPRQPPAPAATSYAVPGVPPSAPPLPPPQPSPPRDHPPVRPQTSMQTTTGSYYPPTPAGPSRVQYSQPSGPPAGQPGVQYSQQPQRSWQFSQPMMPMATPAHPSLFNVSIKPREPPPFSGDKGQDVVAWLHQVDDYLEFVQPDERQAVAYIILLLHGNARIWWEAEYVARGHHRPDSVLELKLLLRTAFESPVREQRARSELLNLQQRTGENASTYMARTRALLHKVPGYDEKTALQQWLLGLRQPYRLEAAKQYPRTMAEAELLVSRLEDAMEFARGGRDDQAKPRQTQRGQQQQGQRPAQQTTQKTQPQQYQQRGPHPGGNVVTTYRPPQYPPGLQRGSGRGGPPQPGPYRPPQGASHPAPRPAGVPGGRGRGRGRHPRPRLAYIQAREDGTLVLVDESPESTQQVDGEEPVASQGQSLGN